MSLYIAAYDVENSRQRARVARVLRRYGERIQRSVFEVWLEPDELPELKREIGPLLAKTDAFDLYPVDLRPSRPRLRWQRPPSAYETVVEL